MNFKRILLIIPAILFFTAFLLAAGKGSITGTVVDSETGDALIGANIYLENTSLGAASDLNGRYTIMKIPDGSYTLIISVIGYAETKITNVIVKEADVTKLNIAVIPEILTTDVVVVEAKAVGNTEAALLKSRQKAIAMSDAISAEAMSQAGSDNAADAMKQVTGASIVEGKYVYVRGLGDRYTSTQLNGAELPSTDPYRRSGSIDLIPSYLIDNIVTVKSFTPDKPGNFSGGTVDIRTKDFPDKLNFTIGVSSSVNPQANYNSNTISSYNSSTDWLGFDDGNRSLPEMVSDDLTSLTREERIAVTREFNQEMGPSASAFPINQSIQLTFGNQVSLFNKSLGFIASASYKRNYNSYDGGIFQRWNLGAENIMENVISLNDAKSVDEVLWGAMIKTSYQLSTNHQVSLNGMFNQNGSNESRDLWGSYPYDLDEGKTFQTSVLSYNSRSLQSGQLNGDHVLPSLFDFRINWKASVGHTDQDEPDLRYFTNFYMNIDGERSYGIKLNTPPSRYYRDLKEDRNDVSLDLTLPFKQWSGQSANFKFGGLLAHKSRDYHERLFKFVPEKKYYYNGNRNELLNPENIGVIDSSVIMIRGQQYVRYTYGLSVDETILPANNYHAEEDISAAYVMLDLPLFSRLRFVGGARLETTTMNLLTQDENLDKGRIDTEDILPSLNLIYGVSQNMNIRAAYSKTLARPNFREIGPFATIDFVGGETYIGNPSLRRTLITNADLRWEWYSRPGEIYAVSAFYKEFDDPIERVYNLFGESTWKNVDQATAYGVEFEVRKQLDIISPYLRYFTLGTNLSLIQSRVDITAEELALIHNIRPDATAERPFQGQSPYLANINLTYDDPEIGLSSSIYYNRFGKRLYRASYAATPDVYELPVDLLNFNIGWQFTKLFSFKFSAKNILNSDYKKVQGYQGKDYLYSLYKKGRSFSIGIGYRLY